MDEEFLDRIDRLLNPEGATETGALLGATMTPGVSTGIDAADLLMAIRNKEPGRGALALAGMVSPVSGAQLRAGGKGIRSLVDDWYHGSPKLFDKFDIDKLTELGAEQARGLGHYITDAIRRGVGFAKKGAKLDPDTGLALPRLDEAGEELPLGYLYKVRLNAPEADFIRYHQHSLEGQPKAYQDLYKEFIANERDEVQSLFDLVTDLESGGTFFGNRVPQRSREGFQRLFEEHGYTGSNIGGRGVLESILYDQYDIPGALVKDVLMGDEKNIVAYGDDVLDIISRNPVFSGGIKSLRSR